MNSPRLGEREIVYKNPYQQIHRLTADFGPFCKNYFINELGHRAGMVVVQGDQVLLVRQYRLFIDQISWEIPGGKVDVDKGETPVQAAVRECLEETGVHCLNLHPLLFYHLSLDMLYNPTHLFYCHEIASGPKSVPLDPQEVSGWTWLSLAQCQEMIGTGQIVDSFSIIALLTYQAFITARS
jgi:ADP-ribose pyrophosphatase